jgi:seryl-tRNA synthetase
MTSLADLTRIGLRWQPAGRAGFTGPLLTLADDLDRAFRALAARWDAAEERHPAALPADLLDRLGYLESFPQQATFPVGLAPVEDDLGHFVRPDGSVTLTRPRPVTEVLTPAACYHLYAAHEGETLTAPLYLTTRNTCFRQETRYEPLRRQQSFTMREIVCLGTPGETAEFLAQTRADVDRLARSAGLPVDWMPATDPFFRPRGSPGYLMQRVQPSKHEALYGASLALGSVNLHRAHFGTAFGITRDGVPVSSACVAFGVERWMYAVADRHGLDPANWPLIAEKVMA